MRNKLLYYILFVLAALVPAYCSVAAPTLNYQGRLTASGTNYTGTGYFKFVLRNGNNEGLWSNDGSSEPGIGEPTGSVTIEVNNGLFNVELGDTSVPGMSREISPLVFHAWDIYLRTWFSTDNATFERLAPDVEIHPTDLAHLNTGNMVLVDDDGKADFDDIQKAIDCVATTDAFSVVMVMPGYYPLDAPLVIPTNGWMVVKGVADRSMTWIERTNGAAVIPGDGMLENLGIEGGPAIEDYTIGGVPYNMQIKSCQLRNSRTPGRVTISMESWTNGLLRLSDCYVENTVGASVLFRGGRGRFEAVHSEFAASGGNEAVLHAAIGWPSIALESCRIRSESGAPSLLSEEGWGNGSFVSCDLQNSVVVSNGGFHVWFRDSQVRDGLIVRDRGHAELRDSELTGETSPALLMSDDAQLEGLGCWFHSNGKPAIQLSGNVLCCLRSCEANGMSVAMEVADRFSTFDGCQFWSAVDIDGGEFGARFSGCDIPGLRLFAPIGRLEFCECDIHTEDRKAVDITGQHPRGNVSFRNCDIYARSNTAFFVHDSLGDIDVKDCEIHADSAHAVEVIADSYLPGGWEMEPRFVGCFVLNQSSTVTNRDAIVVTNAPGNPANDTWAGIVLRMCDVTSDIRSGVACTRGWVDVEHTSIYGVRHGILALDADGVSIVQESAVYGGSHAVYASNSEVGVRGSELIGGEESDGAGDGIHAVGESELFVTRSVISGESDNRDDPGGGRGIYAALRGEDGKGFISHSLIWGARTALECDGGVYGFDHSTFRNFDFDQAALLRNDATEASFDNCSFQTVGLDMAQVGTNSAIVLYGEGGGTNAPTPRLINCTIDCPASPYAIDVAGGVTTGNVIMMGTGLSTNISPRISTVAPKWQDAYGNYVFPDIP